MSLEKDIEKLKADVIKEINSRGTVIASSILGLDKGYISRFKNGRVNVSARQLLKFAKILGIKE